MQSFGGPDVASANKTIRLEVPYFESLAITGKANSLQRKRTASVRGQMMLLLLPDPFQGMRLRLKTMEPKKPGNSPGPGQEVVKRQSRQKPSGAESVAGPCSMG